MASNSLVEEENGYSWTLDTIPPEIFLHICSFLSSKFVINVLSLVCQKFKDIISSDATWRMRIRKRWPKKYPIISVCTDFDWKEACIAREEHYSLWKNSCENMKMYHLKEAHFGCVNVVSIIEDGSICASGGRDGALKLWDLAQLNELPVESDTHSYNSCLLNARESAHNNAWLWSLAYGTHNKTLYSGGFDCNLKSWQIEDTSAPLTTYSLASPILCLSYHDNTLVSGCFGRSVSIFDPRVGIQPVFQHIHHRKPVLCIVSDDKYIISGSEDKTVIVYDKVARSVLKTLQFKGFPLSMCYAENQILVGDILGLFHVIDPTNQAFDLFQSYETGHSKKVTGIQQTLGSIITCSTDKTIRVLEPTVDPQPIAVIECNEEISKVSTYNTTLASANTDDSITIWMPKGELN